MKYNLPKHYERFLAIDGSLSAHCCFAATVVDTTKKEGIDGIFETVCECFSMEQAKKVQDALNTCEFLLEM